MLAIGLVFGFFFGIFVAIIGFVFLERDEFDGIS